MTLQFKEEWYLAFDSNKFAATSLTLSKLPYFWRAGGSMTGVIFQVQEKDPLRLALPHDSNVPTVILAGEDSEGKMHAWLWALDPCLPDKGFTRPELIGWAKIVSGAVVGAFAGPAIIMWGVGALGFGAGGIAAGSIGAGMMSAEAIAGGGMIAAGGTVATLQSIGAAGLSAVGTSVAAGAGAATVGAVVGTTSAPRSTAGKNGQNTTGANPDVDRRLANRPFAGWRDW